MELSDKSARFAPRLSHNSPARKLALLADCAFGATRFARHGLEKFSMENSPAAVGDRPRIDLSTSSTEAPA